MMLMPGLNDREIPVFFLTQTILEVNRRRIKTKGTGYPLCLEQVRQFCH
jgi:hypothetical protein